jgi:unsaturated chondroitin disaccharide hydrolase
MAISDSPHAAAGPDRTLLEQAFALAEAKLRTSIERNPDFFPIYTRNGKWNHEGALWTDWCAGFYAGMMWLIFERTADPWWRARAEHYSRLLEHKYYDTHVHDLGFIFLNTYLPWYRLTGDAALKRVLVQAGRTLAGRFQPKGGYLCSFLGTNSLFIDIMMNVPLIFFAAKETGDEALFELAAAHCRTTARVLVRADGGTAHEGLFDTATGEFLVQSTQQGWRADSTWTRGLAWSLYGFGTVFSYTQDLRALAVAERNADCFLRRLPASAVPPWDFDAPGEPGRLDDSSAGAIAASGLWNLAEIEAPRSQVLSRGYRDASLRIVASLCTDRYLSWNDSEWEGVLKHGVYHIHKGLGVDESVMWGEFFFLEAVCKMLRAGDSSQSPRIGPVAP